MGSMELHEKLEGLREQHGISVRELARKLRVKSDTTVRRWMTGEAEPRFSEAVECARFFGVPLDFLADDGETEVITLNRLSDAERSVLSLFRALRLSEEEALRRLSGRPAHFPEAVSNPDDRESAP